MTSTWWGSGVFNTAWISTAFIEYIAQHPDELKNRFSVRGCARTKKTRPTRPQWAMTYRRREMSCAILYVRNVPNFALCRPCPWIWLAQVLAMHHGLLAQSRFVSQTLAAALRLRGFERPDRITQTFQAENGTHPDLFVLFFFFFLLLFLPLPLFFVTTAGLSVKACLIYISTVISKNTSYTFIHTYIHIRYSFFFSFLLSFRRLLSLLLLLYTFSYSSTNQQHTTYRSAGTVSVITFCFKHQLRTLNNCNVDSECDHT